MASAKKTVKVDMMLDYANTQLKRTDEYADMKFKAGISVMIEQILHRANAYNGFTFLDSNDSEIETVGYYSRCYFPPR